MTILTNTQVNTDDVADYWLDYVAEMVDGGDNPVELDYEAAGGRLRLGDREVRVAGAWSEVVFQWYSLATPITEGDRRLPLTYDAGDEVSAGETVWDVLKEAAEWLEGWKADIDWCDLDYELWAQLDDPEVVAVEDEGRCYRDREGYVWTYTADDEKGCATVSRGLLGDGRFRRIGTAVVEGLDALDDMTQAVGDAVEELKAAGK